MVYECERCEAALPPGARACPNCGDPFDEPVPGDAHLPQRETPGPLVGRLLTAGVLAVVLLACVEFVVPLLSGRIAVSSPDLSSPAGLSAVRQSVVYKVAGTAARATIIYETPAGTAEQVPGVSLPWTKTCRMKPGSFLALSAQNSGQDGHTAIEIDIDGALRKKAVSGEGPAIVVVKDRL